MEDSPPPPRRQRSTLAIVGITLGVLALLGLIAIGVVAAILFPVFARSREQARSASCMSYLKQLSIGVYMYLNDYDEKFPLKENWAEGLMPYIMNREVYECPSGGGYSYNSELSGLELGEIPGPAECPMLFDSDAGAAPFHLANNNDPLTSFVKRHPASADPDSGGNIAYADGHVEGASSPPEARAGLDEEDGAGFFFE